MRERDKEKGREGRRKEKQRERNLPTVSRTAAKVKNKWEVAKEQNCKR
jgi:hypothetical protein